MVNMVDYPDQDDIEEMEDKYGFHGTILLRYWKKILQENVIPLISHPGIDYSSMTSVGSNWNYIKEPIAIVGMSCRYPGSNSLEEFWNLLFQGEDGTSSPPPFRWSRDQCVKRTNKKGKINAGFLKFPVDKFDAKFFGISPKEALQMDPQHRLLHELVWEGLENACIDPHKLRGTSGSVFLGSWMNEYKNILTNSGNQESYRNYMGTSIGAAAARLSFMLGITGPSIATESGCSSAMVAVHLACRSLLLGETNLALACGVNMLLHSIDQNDLSMVVSPDGLCKTFSVDANGFARAEGIGVLVLKRLSDAKKDGDRIWGLIRGSAITQEGTSNSIGTPTVNCESLAIKRALQNANVKPEEVSYVEAHGTGTVVGDPTEIAAIATVYKTPRRKGHLVIGSVKTNVGHTESCSGITGIMKVILAMHHGVIPQHRNFTKLNPAIDLECIPAKIPLTRMIWTKLDGRPRFAGVSSFGITGTDAHVIIEEPPSKPDSGPLSVDSNQMVRTRHILKISSKTVEAMDILLAKYRDFLENSDKTIADICFSANTGRANFPIRVAVIGGTKTEIAGKIQSGDYQKHVANPEEVGKICFLFTGQGSQYPGMAKKLYDTSPIFRIHFAHCEKILRENYNISLLQVLWGPTSDPEKISRSIYSQTSIFCVEYALLRLWESCGIIPDFVLGHSLGEFCAAVCCGILTLQDAIELVAKRSQLIDQLPCGKMLVVQADTTLVDNMMHNCSGKNKDLILDYAAINSTNQTVVAGDSKLVLEFAAFLKKSNIKCTILNATHAFHSRQMDLILKSYHEVAAKLASKTGGKIGYVSGMLGKLISADNVNASYWTNHSREKVNFLEACKTVVELGCRTFIEIGPHPVLSALTMTNVDHCKILCVPSLKKGEDEWCTILTSMGKLYVNGVNIKWSGLDEFFDREKVGLPHYPFIGNSFWPDVMQSEGKDIHPLLGSIISNASSVKLFQSGIDLAKHGYLKDHCIGQNVIFPGACYLEMCLAAGHVIMQGCTDFQQPTGWKIKVENLVIVTPLWLKDAKTLQIQTVVDNVNKQGTFRSLNIKIFNRMEKDSAVPLSWLLHAQAMCTPIFNAEEIPEDFDADKFVSVVRSACQDGNEIIIQRFYGDLASLGLSFGPVFHSIEKVWKYSKHDLIAKVRIPENELHKDYVAHPLILDAMIQAIMFLRMCNNWTRKLPVPCKIGSFFWISSLSHGAPSEIFIKVLEQDQISLTTSSTAYLLDSVGNILAVMTGVEFVHTTLKAIESVLEQQIKPMPAMWEEVWRPKSGPMQHRVNLPFCEAALQSSLKHLRGICYQEELAKTLEQLDTATYYNMLKGLYKCGWSPQEHPCFNENQLFSELKLHPQFKKQFGFFMQVLFDEKIILKDGNDWRVIRQPPTLLQITEQLIKPMFSTNLLEKFPSARLLHKVSDSLCNVLRSRQSALDILFSNQSSLSKQVPTMTQFYIELFDLLQFESLWIPRNNWLEEYQRQCAINCNPKSVFRILEVGAGTGGYTQPFLELMTRLNIQFEYTYTDISTAFFPAAERRFESYMKHMKFQKLNVEEDPMDQGFVPGYYDYVCAFDVIHATKNLSESLGNIRTLMKPGGFLDLYEMTRMNRFVTFLFGLLDGYWRFEDFDVRKNHCSLPTKGWVDVLDRSGFRVVSTFDCANDHHTTIKSVKKPPFKPVKNYKAAKKSWLIFHQESSDLSHFLVDSFLELATNREVVIITKGIKFDAMSSNTISLRPNSDKDFMQLMGLVGSVGAPVEGIVYCWSLDESCTTQEHILQPLFFLSKSLFHLKQTSLPRLCVLASGTVPVEDSELSNYPSSTLWGFCKCLRNENSDLYCKCIDVGNGAGTKEEAMLQIFYEIWETEENTQVAFYGCTRYVPKFIPYKPILKDLKLPAGIDRFQLVFPESKTISDLEFGPMNIHNLALGEIEIHVKTTALNFRDVLSVLKPTLAFKNVNTVGTDFAGVVTRIHPEVRKWHVGDSAYGINIGDSGLPSHVIVHEDDAHPVPSDMTFVEACTLPTVMATSYYCLIKIARLMPTDIVLIHSASGGVGLSAIQICQHVGATIITTAGSKRKQRYLRSLGIQHIFHSRTTEYADRILEVTNGKGVDVVLNSLTGKGFKENTLRACAYKARFIEISKLTIWKPEEVRKLRPDVEYQIFDLTSLEISLRRSVLANVHKLVNQDNIKPIPYQCFQGVNIREALQYMQNAKHIGKLVCVMPEIKYSSHGNLEIYTPLFNNKSTYLITGGLGGIGFEVCKWMMRNGAKHVLLAGRTQPDAKMITTIDQLNQAYGGSIRHAKLNVGNYEECRDLIQQKIVAMRQPKLKGIMHCAGMLNDGLVVNQKWSKLSSTFEAKISGTLNLHELTANLNLEHFVLFSSFSALIGYPGQCNHAAGNSFEDALAFYRVSVGLPAISINWGQWSEVGVAMEANLPGIRPLSNLQGLTALEYNLKAQRTQTCVVTIESPQLLCKLFSHVLFLF